MNNDGQLIECPNCAKEGKKQVLGRMLTNGDFMVLRFHHGTTILHAETYSLVCGCGYIFDISGTVITQQIMPNFSLAS